MTTRRSLIKIFAAAPVLLWFGSRTSVFESALAVAENAGSKSGPGQIKLYSV